MICGFCGQEFDESDGRTSCGGCPGGCHSIHCPRCNYKNPQEPRMIKRLRTIIGAHTRDKGGRP